MPDYTRQRRPDTTRLCSQLLARNLITKPISQPTPDSYDPSSGRLSNKSIYERAKSGDPNGLYEHDDKANKHETKYDAC